MSRINLLDNLQDYSTDMLIAMLTKYCTLASHAIEPILRATGRLSADEVLAELGRRNDEVIAHREAGAKSLVDEAMAIVTTRSKT